MNIAEKRLPSAIPITGRRFIHVSEQCIVCCIAFRLLYCITVSVHDYVVVCYTDSGLCGLFSPPQKTANTVPLHTYQRMFFASAIAATDKDISQRYCIIEGSMEHPLLLVLTTLMRKASLFVVDGEQSSPDLLMMQIAARCAGYCDE